MTRRSCRIPALLLIAAAASLAAAAPVASQAHQLEEPRLLNEDEILQRIITTYPSAQREGGGRGNVVLNFKVRADSSVDPGSISVLEASDPAFAAPATAVVPGMRFAPARMGGRPVPVWIRRTIVFDVHRPTIRVSAEPGEGTYEMSEVDEMPTFVDPRAIARGISRRYPPILSDSAISGSVQVRFRILEDGTVDSASVTVEMTTEPRFDWSATDAIRDARFRPAKVNGRPVRVWVAIPIRFEPALPPPADFTGTAPPAAPAARPAPDSTRRTPSS